jgi:hypothetical protein
MPAAKTSRIFKGGADEMITALTVLFDLIIPKRDLLFVDYPHWADPYLTDIQVNINEAFKKFIGFDTSKELRDATAILVSIQTQALADLTTLKKQIEILVKDNATKIEYLKNLGFDEFYKAAKSKKSQPDSIKQLFRINKSITIALKKELVAQKITPALLDRLIAYADTLNNSNITQETFKYLSPEQTNATNIALNTLYTNALDVVKLSADFFLKKDKNLSKQLSYSAALKSVKSGGGGSETKTPGASTPL